MEPPTRPRLDAEARALLVGLDAPEARTSAPVAFLLAPMARTWLDTARGHHGPASLAELTSWVRAVEALATWYRRSVSAESAADGLLGPDAERAGDPDLCTGVTTEVAGHRLGITPRSVLRLLDRGELHGVRISQRVWLIDPDSIDTFIRTRGHDQHDGPHHQHRASAA